MTDSFLQLLADDDPAPGIHALRASDPVHFAESLGFWFLTRHDDIKHLFNNPEYVTHDKRAWEFYAAPPPDSMRRWAEDKGIFAVGKEEHARIRRLAAAAFTPRAVARMELQTREVINRIAAPLRGRNGEVIDILGRFTNIVPNAVVSRITGVSPGGDEARFCKIAQAVVQGFLPFMPEDVQREAELGFREFATLIKAMVEARRAHPQEDLVSDLIRAQDIDEALSDEDIVLLLASLIGAGSEATASVSTSVVRMLFGEPEVLQRLRDDRSLIRRSIDEILRYGFSPPFGTMRFAVRDFELRGKQIRKGQMLMLSVGGSSRDPEVFENPDVLDLDRPPRNLLTFGNGPHYCLGVNLARDEISTMLDVLLDVIPPGSEICKELLEYRDMGLFRQAINLPIRIGPRQ
jgi:cytochrome P450